MAWGSGDSLGKLRLLSHDLVCGRQTSITFVREIHLEGTVAVVGRMGATETRGIARCY